MSPFSGMVSGFAFHLLDLLGVQEMYDLDLAQFDKIAVTLDKFKIGVEGASGVWVVTWIF